MIETLNNLSQMWWNWMAPMFWQVSLLVLIVSLVDLAIKKWAWPQVRYALWVVVLLKLVLPPSWSMSSGIIPNVYNYVNPEQGASAEIVIPDKKPGASIEFEKDQLGAQSQILENTFENPQNFGAQSQIAKSIDWKVFLMGAWVIGVFSFAAFLLLRISKLRKWHAEQEEKKNIPVWFHELLLKIAKQISLERIPAIVFSKEAATPAVYGMFRPVLLLPEKYIDSLEEEEAEHILLHELSHVKRGDLIVHGICLFLQIIYWFNPLLIWVRKEMKHVREICCDLTIANILKERTASYKQTLVDTARKLLTETPEPGMGLLGLFEEPFRLISRIKWLDKNSWESRKTSILTAIIIGVLFTAFVLPMGEIESSSPNTMNNKTGLLGIEEVTELVEHYDDILNKAFMEWDIDEIVKHYTDDVVLDNEGEPTLKGVDNLKRSLKEDKLSGMNFNHMEDDIIEIWEDEINVYAIETYYFDVTVGAISLRVKGTGSSFTVWQKQDDGSIKIDYSILNFTEFLSTKVIEEDEK